MGQHTVEGGMKINVSEPATLSGRITVTLFDKDGNEVRQSRHNLVTDNLKQRLLRRLYGGLASFNETGQITRLAFGTSNATPVATNEKLALEFYRKPLTFKVISGNHFIADCNISFVDLNTAQTTLTGALTTTSFDVASAAGFRVGDYLEINPVNTISVVTDAQYTTITNITGNTITVSPALALGGSSPPTVGWYVMQLIREIGSVMDTMYTTIASAASPTVFTVNNPAGFAANDLVRIRIGSDYEYDTIQTVVGSTVTLTNGLSTTPTAGYSVENGKLANHATGFTFRKTSAYTAVARIDFSMD